MSIDFRTDLEGIRRGRPVSMLHAGEPRRDADPGRRHVVTAAGERIQVRVNAGMRSPVGILAGAAGHVSPGG